MNRNRSGVGRLTAWLSKSPARKTLSGSLVRATLAALFVFTGSTHFTDLKHDFLAMLPSAMPGGMAIIYVTGVLEIAGGLGLLVPQVRRLAGVGLIVLLVAMFPANISAAINDVPFRDGSHPSLWIRTPIQLLLIVSIWWAAVKNHETSSSSGGNS